MTDLAVLMKQREGVSQLSLSLATDGCIQECLSDSAFVSLVWNMCTVDVILTLLIDDIKCSCDGDYVGVQSSSDLRIFGILLC